MTMNNIIVTGANSGIGKAIVELLDNFTVYGFTRQLVDMDIPNAFNNITIPNCDMLFNVAGHDVGGKVDFINHNPTYWQRIFQTNLINTIALTQKVLINNPNAIIVNITSTNVDQYYPNDLIYSLTKSALSTFTEYLRIEYPENSNNFKEVRLGLTKTNFVKNRHSVGHIDTIDLYSLNDHLTPNQAATQIVDFAFTSEIIKWVKI